MELEGVTGGADYTPNLNDFYTESYILDGQQVVKLGYKKDLGKSTKVEHFLFSSHTFKYGDEAVKLWKEVNREHIEHYIKKEVIAPKVQDFARKHFNISGAIAPE